MSGSCAMNGSSKRTFKHTAERLSWSRSARQASAACVTKRLPHRRCQPDTPGLRRQSRLAVPLAQPLESRRSQLAGGSLLAAASAARSHLVDRAGRCGPPASSTRAGARTSWLRHAGHTTSASSVGRIVCHLRQSGRLRKLPAAECRPAADTCAAPTRCASPPSSASRVPERLGTDRYSRRPDPAGGAAQAVHRRRLDDIGDHGIGHPNPLQDRRCPGCEQAAVVRRPTDSWDRAPRGLDSTDPLQSPAVPWFGRTAGADRALSVGGRPVT